MKEARIVKGCLRVYVGTRPVVIHSSKVCGGAFWYEDQVELSVIKESNGYYIEAPGCMPYDCVIKYKPKSVIKSFIDKILKRT